MPISSSLAEGLYEVDVIIRGGGTSGCTVAGRLAEADPHLSILLIEGGESNANLPTVQHPALFPVHQLPGSRTTIPYRSNKSEALAGRAPVILGGGVLGGGGFVNFMLCSRAQGQDFDGWNTPGWSAKDLAPFMERMIPRCLETYHGLGKTTHGHDGPVQNPTEVNNGWEKSMKNITLNGLRADAASAYIHPLINGGNHPSLHVLTENKVARVLFDESKRAVGVECTTNPQYLPAKDDATKRQTFTVKAKKLVVLSTGAMGTPLLLQRSDVKGVGAQYDDHPILSYPFKTNLSPEDTLDGLFSGRMSPEEAEKKGLLAWNGNDIHAKLRPTKAEVEAMGPKFKQLWDKDFKDKPHKPLLMMAGFAGFLGDPSTIPPSQVATCAIYSTYAYSAGEIRITGPNLEDPIDFEVGYFTDKDDFDVKANVWGYKRMRALFRSTEMYQGELQLGHPEFAEGSKAACASDSDAKTVVKSPKYSAEDDEAIEKHLRAQVVSCWHSIGTCLMRPREEGDVVDASLNVYGVQGLKCVALSIAGQVAANTNNTALVVGEEGADIIIRELGLR